MSVLPGFALDSRKGRQRRSTLRSLAGILLSAIVISISGVDLRARVQAAPIAITVALAPGSDSWKPGSGITTNAQVQVVGQTQSGTTVGVDRNGDGIPDQVAQANRSGQFTMTLGVQLGANLLSFGAVGGQQLTNPVTLSVVYWPNPFFRPFNGSPTPGGQPFGRLIPNSQCYAKGLPSRPPAMALSGVMIENPHDPAFSPNIVLGLVFYGQFVDHDVTLNESPGQGPSHDPPIDVRTPALDLDSVYGSGPQIDTGFYTQDGLLFQLGENGTDLLRDDQGVAIIGDPRNDDNGLIRNIHLSFQKYHNLLMSDALNGVPSGSLSSVQKAALFAMVRNDVIAFHQGIVTNELAIAFTGRPVPDNMPPATNIPVEFSAAVYRLGHSLVPNTIAINEFGDRMSPTDPRLRAPGNSVPFSMLFGPRAQPAARFDALISMTMHTLLIPFSPTNRATGDLIGGNSPNIGQGRMMNGVMHLDLAETNILRGREQRVPSGEEYLAMMNGLPYNPLTSGNTDLFLYILHEAAPLGHLGRVGTNVFDRAIGGIIAGDPYRYTNPALFTPMQTFQYRQATVETLLLRIGALAH